MKIKILIPIILVAAAMQSCGDEHQFLPEVKVPDAMPKIKFIHAAADTVGVNLFLDGLKITGNTPSTISTVGSTNFGKVNIGTITYQNSFPVTNYTEIASNSGTLSVIVPETYNATTTFPTKTMATLSGQSFDPDKHYTVAFMGVTKSYELVAYEDDLSSTPIDGQIYVRFANFIANSTDNLTLRATPPATSDDPNPAPIVLFSNVPYKTMTGFVALPRTGTYTNVQIVNANTGAVVTTLAATSSAFASNKVYTVFARGRISGTGSVAPGLSRVINR